MVFPSSAGTARFAVATIVGALLAAASSPATAQQTTTPPSPPSTNTPTAPARGATIVLVRALDNLSKEAGLSVLADSTVAAERIPVPASLTPTQTTTPVPEAELEKQLDSLMRTLPQGTVWIKLQLPAPASGRTWKGDDVAAFAFAQARLFGTIGVPSKDGSIEILGKRVAKEATPPYVTGLDLKPVYLVINTRRKDSATSWSPNIEKQWATMTPEERKQFGQDQAALFLSLPSDQQAQMIRDIKQHDKFFDAVKGPMEKVIGHDL